jgi:hypothetical protein
MSGINFTERELAEIETLTLTKTDCPVCKGRTHSNAAIGTAEHFSEDRIQTGQGWAYSELPRRHGGEVRCSPNR